MKKRPTALGCYIFAGGFTVGVAKHFDVLAHFEEGPYGTATAAHNFPFLRDRIFMDPPSWPVADYARRVDFVYGNPPCAPWSVCSAGRVVPWQLDPRLGCAKRLFDLVDSLEPKVWAWESVRPAFNKGRELVDSFVAHAAERGYDATALMVEGTRHGVPQRRPRFFLVLSKYRIGWEPTHANRVITVGEAFAKPFSSFTCTKEGSPFFLALVRKTKPGKRVAALFNELYPERVAEGERTGEWVKGRPSFQNIRLDPDQPSCTLTGGAKQIHPKEHRFISVEESGVLCGYPRSFKFLGSIGMQYKQVAQAVMPPVGEYLARMVSQALATKAVVRKPSFERVEIFVDHVDRAPLTIDAGAKVVAHVNSLHDPATTQERKKMPNPTIPCPTCRGTGKILAPPSLTKPGVAERIAEAPPPKVRKQKAPVVTSAKTAKALATKALAAPAKVGKLPAPSNGKGSGFRIRQLLVAGKDDAAILAVIHKEFPDSKAGKSDISWNRRKLATQGGVP